MTASYGPVQVLDGVSLTVPEGGSVGILGANGAGKTTTLRAISGTVRTGGRIRFAGRDIRGLRPDRWRAARHRPRTRGPRHARPAERPENLAWAPTCASPAKAISADVDYCLELFPQLKDRIGSRAAALSGGEQQMLAVARAFMAKPKLLLLDEASLGLAPSTAKSVYAAIRRLRPIGHRHGGRGAERQPRLLASWTRPPSWRRAATCSPGSSAELKGMDEIRRAYLGG